MKILILFILVALTFARSQRRLQNIKGRSEIVGGTDAAPGEFPYQLSFQSVDFPGYSHFCGATLYLPAVAICAAHCVYGKDYDSPVGLNVLAGAYNLKELSGNEQRVDVQKITIHENFNHKTFENDISLLFLASDVVFNSMVGPVTLPALGQEFTGDFIVTGWGETEEGGFVSNVLQKVTVPFVDDETCRNDYANNLVTDSMICAGAEGLDACQGDSGGPMTQNDVLVGIVSWGEGCARPGKPGVYTQVSYFVDWIQAHLH